MIKIGKWEFDKLPDSLKITVEFMKGGKVKYEAHAHGKQETLEGTYKVDGDMLTIETKKDGNETTKKLKITKLSKKECTLIDDDREGEQTSMEKLP